MEQTGAPPGGVPTAGGGPSPRGAPGEPTYVLYVGSGATSNHTDTAPALAMALAARPPHARLSLVWPRGAPDADDVRTHENLVGLRDHGARCARAKMPLPPYVCGRRARVAGFVRLALAFVDDTKAPPQHRARRPVHRVAHAPSREASKHADGWRS